MSNTLEYIKTRGVQEALRYFEEELHLKIKQDGEYVLLDYDQINSPRKHPIVDECRGVIIDLKTLSYACRPFNRFYNYGEFPELEKEFDWSTAKVDEKVDGSLIKVWYNIHDGRWEIATRGSLYGDNNITTLSGEDSQITFRQLFLRALGMTEHEWNVFTYENMACGFTFLFELCTIENKVVTAYDGDRVYFLGAIENYSGRQNDSLIPSSLNFNYPERYDIHDFQTAVDTANKLPNLKEGFVICDSKLRRMKIKSIAYVAAHHLRGEGVTPKRAVLLALAGEVPEFVSYFPEYAPLLEPYQNNVDSILEKIDIVYDEIKEIEDQKEFAKLATKHHFSGLLFAMRKGFTKKDVIDNMTTNAKLSVFGANHD